MKPELMEMKSNISSMVEFDPALIFQRSQSKQKISAGFNSPRSFALRSKAAGVISRPDIKMGRDPASNIKL